MKTTFLTILLCLLLGLNIFAQNDTKPDEKGVAVEEIYFAKDDNGKMGDVVTSFLTTDIPIYCVVQLDSLSPVTVKMNLIAVSVKGVKPGTKVISTSFKTNGQQSRVNFTGKPDGAWVAGNYRVDIFLDDKPAGNQAFDIQGKSANDKSAPPAGSDKNGDKADPKSARLAKRKLN